MSHSCRSHSGTRVVRLHIVSRDIVPICLETSFHLTIARGAGSPASDPG
jgi:hypothetical protein